MGDVINLNEARKKRAKAEKQKITAVNRARHGRTKQAKDTTRRKKDREAAALDAKLLEDKSGAKSEPE